MNALEFLDLVIGLIFIYLIYSISASCLWEMFVNASHLKGNMLSKWIMTNFPKLNYEDEREIAGKGGSIKKKKKSTNHILEHPVIKIFHYPIVNWNIISFILRKDRVTKPAYISSKVFADVLLDLITSKNEGNENKVVKDPEKLLSDVKELKLISEPLTRVFSQFADEAGNNLQEFKNKIATWYDEAQERLIGSYKKNLQMWIFMISAILVGITNADTFNFISYLHGNDEARIAIADKATLLVQDSAVVRLIKDIENAKNDTTKNNIEHFASQFEKYNNRLDSLQNELKQTNLPIGWNQSDEQKFIKSRKFRIDWWLKKVTGLLLTTLAVSLGSPFWFDVLSKLSNLRSSGKKPETIVEEQRANKMQIVRNIK
jgi:hypothetical protein